MQQIGADRPFVRPRPASAAADAHVHQTLQGGVSTRPATHFLAHEHSILHRPTAHPQSFPGHIFQPMSFGSNEYVCQADWPSASKVPQSGQSPAVMMSSTSANAVEQPIWPFATTVPCSSPGYVVAGATDLQSNLSSAAAEQCESPPRAARPPVACTLKHDSPAKTESQEKVRRILDNVSIMPQSLAAMEHSAYPVVKAEPCINPAHDQAAMIEHPILPIASASDDNLAHALSGPTNIVGGQNCLASATSTGKLPRKLPWKSQSSNIGSMEVLPVGSAQPDMPATQRSRPDHVSQPVVAATGKDVDTVDRLRKLPWDSPGSHTSVTPDAPASHVGGTASLSAVSEAYSPWDSIVSTSTMAAPAASFPAERAQHEQTQIETPAELGAVLAARETELQQQRGAREQQNAEATAEQAATQGWLACRRALQDYHLQSQQRQLTPPPACLTNDPSNPTDSAAANRKRLSQNLSDRLETELGQPLQKKRYDEPLKSLEFSNKALLDELEQFEFSETSDQSSPQPPASSVHIPQKFRYLGVWRYTTEHQTEGRYTIQAGSSNHAALTFFEGTCADCVSGSLEADGEWLKAHLHGNEGWQVIGTIRLRLDPEHGSITSQFMAPGAPAWGKETSARRCSEEELAGERKLVLGTWCYGEQSDEYTISEVHGKFQYSQRDASAALVDVGIWLQAELLGPQGALIGTVRVRLLREQDALVSQFKSFGVDDWGRTTLARRSQKTDDVDTVEPVQTGKLSEEQQRVVHVVCEGENVFFTGLPGTGKSFTLCAAIAALRSRLREDELAVCASTGAAACHIGGGTVHSFLGCSLGKTDKDFARMVTSAPRLSRAKALVIDEISMLSGDFLERASRGLKRCRKNQRAFGGLQVVLCGDFLQLPPVMSESATWKFAFQAPCWHELNMRTFELTQNFRQADDVGFQEMLQRLRLGQLSHQDRHALLNGSANASKAEKEAMEATTLFCRNIDVEKQNLTRLAQLPGEMVVLRAEDKFSGNRRSMEKILEKCMASQELQLKIGARVMLLKNLRTPKQCKPGERPLVNGSLGTVVRFQDAPKGKVPVVAFSGGRPGPVRPEKFEGSVPAVGTYTRLQVPLKLAWAISVHKSQGSSLDAGTVDLHGAFEAGQVYVALSRFRSSAAIAVRGLPAEVRVSQHAKEFHEQVSAKTQLRVA
eukprot:TRINITY_DN23859_c0_g1_i1.p1 TRINITY_DN23859_c0_g1~~TRINITY_DN23859_c0_g1_i1.p1  ORF type:complete len:1174 (+),score=194.78 TRINITY_DN23859_c0_g1_i1:86-3607(+)